jgi:uncharacterized protein
MTEAEKRRLATTFIDGLRARDADILNAIMAEDVIWSLPGSSPISGEAHGVKGIIERAREFATFSLHIEILYVLFGSADVGLSLHNTGRHNGRILDEHLTTLCRLEGNRIKRLDTYISDVQMLNDYFA